MAALPPAAAGPAAAAAAAPVWVYPAAPSATFPTVAELMALTYDQSTQMMIHHLGIAALLFRWGLRVGGHWQGTTQLLTETDILNWHNAEAAAGGNPLPPVPIPAVTVTAHYAAHNHPLDFFVERNAVRLLKRLHAAGYWNPLGYPARGRSYLVLAREQNALEVCHYILGVAKTDRNYATAHPFPWRITGDPDHNKSHFDYLLTMGDWKFVISWWKSVRGHRHNANLTIQNLNLTSRRILCKAADQRFATYLFTKNNTDLSTTDMTHRVSGSIWHAAVGGRNPTFIDFLAARNAAPNVDSYSGHMATPLDCAETVAKPKHHERLLAAGAAGEATLQGKLQSVPVVDVWIKNLSAHASDMVPTQRPARPRSCTCIMWLIGMISRLDE